MKQVPRYNGCPIGEFRFVEIVSEPRIKQKPGPKPKGHPDYHPPKITKKMGRPRKDKPVKATKPKEKILSCEEADRRLREMDRLKGLK
jgi:hypothetical protein